MLFDLRAGGAARPIDVIESVLSRREKKVATYKLALVRALCDVALTQSHRARFHDDGRVGVPIDAVTDRWVTYCWPLFESREFLPQMNGEWEPKTHQLAFSHELRELIDAYARLGGLTRFVLDHRSGTLAAPVEIRHRTALRKIANTIRVGPVTYAGGSLPERMFEYDRDRASILVPSAVWRELSLMGHWIQDALVLRWADLVHELSRREVPREAVLARLLVAPLPEREVAAAREIFETGEVECVWTGRRLSKKTLAIDHVLPFSLWRNNDLWNLLPADAVINRQKSDRLPTRALLRERRPAIVSCWERAENRYPRRFRAEAAAQTGEDRPRHERLFQVMAESVETTALSRACERWAP